MTIIRASSPWSQPSHEQEDRRETVADFEGALTGIPKKAGLTADETARLGDEIKALGTPDADAEVPEPFSFREIAPGEWISRAADLAMHLHAAAVSNVKMTEDEGLGTARPGAPVSFATNAVAYEVQGRALELSALLREARNGGFGSTPEPVADLDAKAEQADEPLPDATYDEAMPVLLVPLAYPFSIGGQHYDRLDFYPPSFAIVEQVTKGKASEIEMQAQMAGVTTAVIRALRWPDAEAAIAACRHIAPELIARRA